MRLLLILVLVNWSTAVQAQPPDQPATTAPLATQEPERNDPDVRIDPLEPDFTLVALPTTLRMPAGKWSFRVTHRFTRNLGDGDFADLASDLFGLDGGAQIGLEVRIGLRSGTQFSVHRTSDRAIQMLLQQSLVNQRDGAPLGLAVLATLEGDDNLSEHHQSALGAVLSRSVARRVTFYAEPLAVLNANPFETGDDHTFLLGLGGRLRIGGSMYLTGEYAPRVAGYRPRTDQVTFAFENRTGGHLFQLNVGNGFGTTFGQLARGGIATDQWFLGFSISRKFF